MKHLLLAATIVLLAAGAGWGEESRYWSELDYCHKRCEGYEYTQYADCMGLCLDSLSSSGVTRHYPPAGTPGTETHFIVPSERAPNLVWALDGHKGLTMRVEIWPTGVTIWESGPTNPPPQVQLLRIREGEPLTIPPGWEYVETVVGGSSGQKSYNRWGSSWRAYVVIRKVD